MPHRSQHEKPASPSCETCENHIPYANQLLIAAGEIISLAGHIRRSAHAMSDIPPETGNRIRDYLLRFASAAESSYATDINLAATTILAMVLMDVVPNLDLRLLPNSVTRQEMRTASGRRRYFRTILQRALTAPRKHVDLIELIYVCLSAGYILPADEARHLADDTYHVIESIRGNHVVPLSSIPRTPCANTESKRNMKYLWWYVPILLMSMGAMYLMAHDLLNSLLQQITATITTT